MPPGGCQGPRHAGVSCHHIAGRGTRELYRLLAWNDGLDFVLGVIPRRAGFPAKTVIENQVWRDAPTILRVKGVVLAPRIEQLWAGLGQAVGRSDEEVCKIDAGLATREAVLPVFCRQVSFIDLVVVVVDSKLEGMGTVNSGYIIEKLDSIIRLPDRAVRRAEVGSLQSNHWNSFVGRNNWA